MPDSDKRIDLTAREPVIAPNGLWRLAMIIALIVASYWVFQGVGAVVRPIVRTGFEAVGIADPDARRSPVPQHRQVRGEP